MALDKFGQPYGSSWEGMSMGEGRVIDPDTARGTVYEGCPNSPRPDGKHLFRSTSCVQSVERFECAYGCGEYFVD